MNNIFTLSDKLIESPLTPVTLAKDKPIEIIDFLEPISEDNGIFTTLQKAHFFGQLAHESVWFKHVTENLNYSYKALRVIFGKYYPTDDLAVEYARKPEKIANRVYANRMGNGDEKSGDGWRYKGRGLVQITGKENYQNYAKDRGVDFVNNPEWVAEPKWAVDSAVWYWNKHNLNKYADLDDVKTISRKINGDYHGLEDRIRCVDIFKEMLVGNNELDKEDNLDTEKRKAFKFPTALLIEEENKIKKKQIDLSSDLRFSGGEKKYSDFVYHYNLWNEPSINQYDTLSCVEHSHIGAISKMLHNSLNYYSVIGLIARLNTFGGHEYHALKGSSRKTSSFIKEFGLIPEKTYNENIVDDNEYKQDKFYKGLTSRDQFSLSDSKYNENSEKVDDRLNIDYQVFRGKDDGLKIVDHVKNIIDNKGLVMISIDYPTNSSIPDVNYKGCSNNIWLKHSVHSNYWCVPNSHEEQWNEWFNEKPTSYHSVIFFSYTQDSKINGAFGIKNSWGNTSPSGVNHGENGTYYMSYYYLQKLAECKGISVTSITPKDKIDNIAYNDFTQYRNPLGQSLVFHALGKTWILSFGKGAKNLAVGAGIWSLFENITDGKKHTFTISNYSERGGKGDLLKKESYKVYADESKIYLENQDGSINSQKLTLYNYGEVYGKEK